MTVPIDKKEQAIYHTILAEMHRVQGLLLNMQTLQPDGSEAGLLDHFSREQTLALGKLTEWRGRRPEIYRAANEDFQTQIRKPDQ